MSLLPHQELSFQLYECLDTATLLERERFQEHTLETFNAVLPNMRF